MIQLRELRLSGLSKPPAIVTFVGGANVISGASDTGKSYLFRCIDFVLGAEEMSKKVEEDEGYSTVQLQLENESGNPLTLSRQLSGGDITAHYSTIDEALGSGDVVAWKRKSKSTKPDITTVLFKHAGIAEASLRRNAKGAKARLTVRTLLPIFLINENAIIAEDSPIHGDAGFDETARQRMLSYVVTGSDDAGVVSTEEAQNAQATARAKLSVVEELLASLEAKMHAQGPDTGEHETSIERADKAIEQLSSSLAETREERQRLQLERAGALTALQSSQSQILAIDQLLQRYDLLSGRYSSDLKRLDFIAEGSHFLGQLQEARCPLCDQPLDGEHKQHIDGHSDTKVIYESSKAEASKIHGLSTDLSLAMQSLRERRAAKLAEQMAAQATLDEIDMRMDKELAPALLAIKGRLATLIARRLELEAIKADSLQAVGLRQLRDALKLQAEPSGSAKRKWAPIDPIAMQKLTTEIEKVLAEWSWIGGGKVEFDTSTFDIKVDGKPRQSHGKGVRAILHTAFILGLLRYAIKNKQPHPGFVVLDSPLTTYKQGQGQVQSSADKLDPTIEEKFWESLVTLPKSMQVVVIDNKEPPPAVAAKVAYTYFAGPHAKPTERKGFIPV
jgi:hypothetical protein